MKSIHRNRSVEQVMTDRTKDYYLFLISPRIPFENASKHQPHFTEGKIEA